MKSYLFTPRGLVWLVTFVVAFGLACQPQDESKTKTPPAEPAAKTVAEAPVEETTEAIAEPPAETEVVEPTVPPEAPAEPPAEAEVVKPTAPAEAEVQDLNAVAVTVNGVGITEGQVEALLKPQLEKLAAKLPPAFIQQYKKRLRQETMDRLVVEELLNEEVKKARIAVAEEEVTDQLKQMASQQNLSLEDLKALIKASGKSFDEVKQRIQRGLGYQELLERQWAGKINVTLKDANSYYSKNQKQFETPEQVRASHILIKSNTSDPNTDPNQAKAKAKAEGLHKQIEAGADFAELAKANSDCRSAAQGGDLGLFGRGQMVPAFEKAAFAMDVNEVSYIVETQYGFHIIKLTDRKDASTLPFEQAKGDIISGLTQQKQNELAMEYVESLKAGANIVYPPSKEPK